MTIQYTGGNKKNMYYVHYFMNRSVKEVEKEISIREVKVMHIASMVTNGGKI